MNEIRAGYHQESKAIRFVLNEGLFTDLYMFAVARLKVYYEEFKNNSKAYQELRYEVVKQEVLFEILKRYDMIQV